MLRMRRCDIGAVGGSLRFFGGGGDGDAGFWEGACWDPTVHWIMDVHRMGCGRGVAADKPPPCGGGEDEECVVSGYKTQPVSGGKKGGGGKTHRAASSSSEASAQYGKIATAYVVHCDVRGWGA